jgi:alkylation response protein AidB-like acyl-CoA dehydrogenase
MDFTLTETEAMIRDLARKLARERIAPRAAHIDENEEFPHDLVKLLSEQGLMGLLISPEHGGSGAGPMALFLATEEIAHACASTATVFGGHYLGMDPILHAGSDEQKRRWCPDLASGARLAAYALTEPGAGSDVVGMSTTAVRRGEGYVLNGAKQFCTNGDVADLVSVFAVTDRAARHKGITAFVVEKGTPGFGVARVEKKMGIRGSSTAALSFEDCRVPAANRLGEEGTGFTTAMHALNLDRPAVCALAVGIAQAAFDHALAYAQERHQFGQPIAAFQAIQLKLAQMATEIHHARLGYYYAARVMQSGAAHQERESAMAKVFGSDMAMRVTTEAVQIFGGYGYMRDYPVERLMRDAKITQIYAGTNEIQRLTIAKSLLRGR